MISNKIANNTEENVECMFKHVQKNVRIMRPKNELPSFRGKKDVNSEQKLHAGKSSMRNFGAAATLVLHGFFCADLSIVCVCKIYISAKMLNSVQNFAEYESKFTHF